MMEDWLEELERDLRIVLSRLERYELESVLVRSEESASGSRRLEYFEERSWLGCRSDRDDVLVRGLLL